MYHYGLSGKFSLSAQYEFISARSKIEDVLVVLCDLLLKLVLELSSSICVHFISMSVKIVSY